MILFSSARREERRAAERLYAACVAAARRPELFLAFGVPDTLQGRFEMLSLHLFPVLHRLMHDPGDAPDFAKRLAESFVADMDRAFREMGVGDLSVPKRMTALYRSFGGRISAYTAAVGEGDAALADAIARNVFPESADPAPVAAIVAYLQDSLAAVRAAPLADLRAGAAPFPPLPR